MCGIVGYLGDKDAVGVIVEGLKRLEYRGYDSAGVAVLGPAGLEVRRAAGRIKVLEGMLRERPVRGTVGIGHTRWATHGRPTDENAHPHTDGSGTLVVVHNGIIENYLPIKERLAAEGHVFTSETDTEVIAHLIERHLAETPRLEEAVRRALGELKGSYAIVVLAKKGGYRHFMLKEIYEQPRAVADTLRGRVSPEGGTVVLPEIGLDPDVVAGLQRVVFVACGTSYHAAIVGRFLVERLAGLSSDVDLGSEFR